MSDLPDRPGRWTPRLTPRRRRSPWRQPLAVVGGVVLAVWVLVAALAPVLAPYDPLAQSADRLAAPGTAHLLGTDSLGRDVLSRVILGSRLSIPVAAVLVLGCLIIGALLGAFAGYVGGWLDEVIMRIADMVLAFPTIILAMVVAAALGPSLLNAVIAVLLVNWPQYARVTRSLVLGAKSREYVVAGRLLGANAWTSLHRDIAPNVVTPVLVLATLDVGSAILVLSGLSFLGLGTVPPTPEWGSMVADGVQQFDAWWIGTSAGVAIFTVVASINFLGDGLRDSLDPHNRSAATGRAL